MRLGSRAGCRQVAQDCASQQSQCQCKRHKDGRKKKNSHATTDLKKPPDVSAPFKRWCQYLKIALLILDDSRFYVHPSAAWFCSWLSLPWLCYHHCRKSPAVPPCAAYKTQHQKELANHLPLQTCVQKTLYPRTISMLETTQVDQDIYDLPVYTTRPRICYNPWNPKESYNTPTWWLRRRWCGLRWRKHGWWRQLYRLPTTPKEKLDRPCLPSLTVCFRLQASILPAAFKRPTAFKVRPSSALRPSSACGLQRWVIDNWLWKIVCKKSDEKNGQIDLERLCAKNKEFVCETWYVKKIVEKFGLKKTHENCVRKLVSEKVVCTIKGVKKSVWQKWFGERLCVRKFCVKNGAWKWRRK